MVERNSILRLHRGWGYFTTLEGVEVWSFVSQQRFRIKGPPDVLTKLLEALRDGVPIENSIQNLMSSTQMSSVQVEKVVHRLRELGAVLQAAAVDEQITKIPERSLYDPQVEHFSFWEREGVNGREMDRRLRYRRVVLIGLGGYGSWIALLLSRIGIRHIIAVDMDRVELSNLSRQVLYTQNDIGELKVEAAARHLRESDPDICFEGYPLHIKRSEELIPLLEGADLVFNPFGYMPSRIREAITKACVQSNVPMLLSGSNIIGPLCVPGQTPCYQCIVDQNANLTETLSVLHANRWRPPDAPFAPAMSITSSFTILESTRFLSGCTKPRTLHGMYIFNPLNYTIEFRSAERRSDCSVCGDDQLSSLH